MDTSLADHDYHDHHVSHAAQHAATTNRAHPHASTTLHNTAALNKNDSPYGAKRMWTSRGLNPRPPRISYCKLGALPLRYMPLFRRRLRPSGFAYNRLNPVPHCMLLYPMHLLQITNAMQNVLLPSTSHPTILPALALDGCVRGRTTSRSPLRDTIWTGHADRLVLVLAEGVKDALLLLRRGGCSRAGWSRRRLERRVPLAQQPRVVHPLLSALYRPHAHSTPP